MGTAAFVAVDNTLPVMPIAVVSIVSIVSVVSVISFVSVVPVESPVPDVYIRDVSRTIMPGAGNPDAAGGDIRPIPGHPNVTYARPGRDHWHHRHRCRCNRCGANDRCCNDDRRGQSDGDAEADSRVGRQGSHAEQRGHDYDFRFHSFYFRRYSLHQFRRLTNRLVTSFLITGILQ